jgi:hypothetical protein
MSQKSTKAQANELQSFEAIIPGASQKLSFTNVSAQNGTAFDAKTTLLRLFCDVDCYVKRGTNPTAAAADSHFVASGIIEFIGIKRGEKIAAIRDIASGTLYITEAE